MQDPLSTCFLQPKVHYKPSSSRKVQETLKISSRNISPIGDLLHVIKFPVDWKVWNRVQEGGQAAFGERHLRLQSCKDTMKRITLWLWLALAGSILQFIALGSNFYVVNGQVRDAWFGIPHTSDLILLSAIVAVGAFALTALGRNPIKGRNMGLAVGIAGVLATLQLGYRMVIPPFGCLMYACGPSDAADVTLLAGIWIGLVGCVVVAIGGCVHAFSSVARETPARPWVAETQAGMSPWLGVAALAAVAQFIFGYTFFTFYTVTGFIGQEGPTSWGGWIATPHTSSLVLAITLVIVGLVVAAGRGRSPLSPAALGGLVAVLGFASGARILYRIIDPPFNTAGGSTDAAVGSVTIHASAYLAVIAAVVIVVAGIVQATTRREESRAAGPATPR